MQLLVGEETLAHPLTNPGISYFGHRVSSTLRAHTEEKGVVRSALERLGVGARAAGSPADTLRMSCVPRNLTHFSPAVTVRVQQQKGKAVRIQVFQTVTDIF